MRTIGKISLWIFISCISISAFSQKLSAEEKKVLAIIHQSMPETMELLKQLVNINSGSHNIDGVRKAGNLLQKEFEKIGFTTEWVYLPDSLKRAGHLVASRKGTKGKKLLLIGHLDTVFEPDAPENPFTILNDSTATGQGINDMKGGDVLILAALQALHKTGLIKNATITAYFTGDEEIAGEPASITRKDFIDRAKIHDIALGFETAQGLHTVATGRRGASSWQLKVFGKQGHSAGIFNNSYGAVYEAARILNTFRETLSKEKYLSFNPGFFVGGAEVAYDSINIRATVTGKNNIISPSAIVRGDLRFLTAAQHDSARAKMKRIVRFNNLAGTKAEISFIDGIPSMEPTDGNMKLVTILNGISEELGIGQVKAGDPGSRGAGDISYVARYVDALDGLGVNGRGAHSPGETMDIRNFENLIQRAAIFIFRLTKNSHNISKDD